MPNHEIPKMLDELKSQATTEMRKVEKTDDVSADFINPIFKQFLINDQYAFEQMKAIMAMNFVNHLLKTKEKNLLEAVNELFDKIKSNTDLLATKSDTGHTHEQYLEKTSDITGTGDLYNRTQVDAFIKQLRESSLTQEQVQGMITAVTILQKLKTVDGVGSGLDADLLDGLHAGDFLRNNGKSVDSHKLEGHPSSHFATAAQLQEVFQSLADGKSTLISEFNKLLGYDSGLTIQNTWADFVWWITHKVCNGQKKEGFVETVDFAKKVLYSQAKRIRGYNHPYIRLQLKDLLANLEGVQEKSWSLQLSSDKWSLDVLYTGTDTIIFPYHSKHNDREYEETTIKNLQIEQASGKNNIVTFSGKQYRTNDDYHDLPHITITSEQNIYESLSHEYSIGYASHSFCSYYRTRSIPFFIYNPFNEHFVLKGNVTSNKSRYLNLYTASGIKK